MSKLTLALLTGIFFVALSGLSSAGMMDDMLKKSDEATQKVNDANAKAQETGKTMDAEHQKAIDAQSSAKQESGDLSQQLRDAAKEKSNETIDSIGK